MGKIFVLDTSVLMHDINCFNNLGENEIVIPFTVVQELDNNRKGNEEKNRIARRSIRKLDNLIKGNVRKLQQGINLSSGGILKIKMPPKIDLLPCFCEDPRSEGDRFIILTVFDILQKENKKENCKKVILVSKDMGLRLLANGVGIKAIDYLNDNIVSREEDDDSMYSGVICLDDIDPKLIDKIFKEGKITHNSIKKKVKKKGKVLYPNQFVNLKSDQKSAIGIVRYNYIRLIEEGKMCWGIKARNSRQAMAIDALLEPEISLVTLDGCAGTGKTLLSLAVALQSTLEGKAEDRLYKNIYVSRPIVPMGNDIGFLPGDLEEKMDPWLGPIHDNLDLLLCHGGSKKGRGGDEFFDMGYIKIMPLTYIRGRSVPKSFIIIDEAQNLSPDEVKAVITRVSEGSKIVLTGDSSQVDNPFLGEKDNGFVRVINRFKDEPMAAHITLKKTERSLLAERAAQIL